MFGWFKKDDGSYYRPKERLIYKFFDGEKDRKADPLELHKRMMERSADLYRTINLARSQSKDARQGHDEMIKHIRYIFGVKPLGEGGLTEQECMDLLDHFTDFCDGVKKNSPTSPTLPKGTSATSNSSPEENPPTPNSSDSGSTESEPSSAKPEPPTSGSESPSAPSI